MNRLFLFCIGGTGSRVLKSLVYLLAAGVRFPVRELIPIIIDPDKDNGDVEQVIRLLNHYREIRSQINPDKSDFFKTEIIRLSDTVDGDGAEVSQGFRTDIAGKGTAGETFKNFIGYHTLDNETKAFIQLLYNEYSNLESDLTVGFKGHPNMGSIVLNRFQNSPDFRAFVNKLADNDRIFIVSSIFGGTGASGFPLLVKNIREPHENYKGKQAIMKQIPLGALSVLPYFGVEPKPGGAISKDTFINKTKAALSFYGNDLDGINALYYLGDKVHKDYSNQEGGTDQRNDAHFIEIAAALSIVDFAMQDKARLLCDTAGRAIDPQYKEFGILISNAGEHHLDLMNLGSATRELLASPLIRFFYATQFWKNRLSASLANRPLTFVKGNRGVALPETLLNSPFFADNLTPFYRGFERWLEEIERNVRSFRPFNRSSNELHNMVYNVTQASKGIWPLSSSKWDYSDFETALNTVEGETAGMTVEQKFMTLFSLATQNIFEDRIKNSVLG